MINRVKTVLSTFNRTDWLVCTAVFLVAIALLSLSVWSLRGQEHFEMTQPETVRLVHSLDNALAARQQAEAATQNYNQVQAEIKKAHGWPDDLLFNGTEWTHAPKPAELPKPEPKK